MNVLLIDLTQSRQMILWVNLLRSRDFLRLKRIGAKTEKETKVLRQKQKTVLEIKNGIENEKKKIIVILVRNLIELKH
jgi:hypothetical protein